MGDGAGGVAVTTIVTGVGGGPPTLPQPLKASSVKPSSGRGDCRGEKGCTPPRSCRDIRASVDDCARRLCLARWVSRPRAGPGYTLNRDTTVTNVALSLSPSEQLSDRRSSSYSTAWFVGACWLPDGVGEGSERGRSEDIAVSRQSVSRAAATAPAAPVELSRGVLPGDDLGQVDDRVVAVAGGPARKLIGHLAPGHRHAVGVLQDQPLGRAVRGSTPGQGARSFSSDTPSSLPTAALMSCQKAQPFREATRRFTSARSSGRSGRTGEAGPHPRWLRKTGTERYRRWSAAGRPTARPGRSEDGSAPALGLVWIDARDAHGCRPALSGCENDKVRSAGQLGEDPVGDLLAEDRAVVLAPVVWVDVAHVRQPDARGAASDAAAGSRGSPPRRSAGRTAP